MAYPKIKELREKNKLTQQQTAEKLNLPLPTYRSYETGAREPGVDVLIKLSELYDVTTDYLLDHKPRLTMLSPSEINHIKKYRTLDEHGKKIVDIVTDVECERMTEQKEIDISEYTRNIAAGTGNEGFDDNKINEVNDFARQIAELENKSE